MQQTAQHPSNFLFIMLKQSLITRLIRLQCPFLHLVGTRDTDTEEHNATTTTTHRELDPDHIAPLLNWLCKIFNADAYDRETLFITQCHQTKDGTISFDLTKHLHNVWMPICTRMGIATFNIEKCVEMLLDFIEIHRYQRENMVVADDQFSKWTAWQLRVATEQHTFVENETSLIVEELFSPEFSSLLQHGANSLPTKTETAKISNSKPLKKTPTIKYVDIFELVQKNIEDLQEKIHFYETQQSSIFNATTSYSLEDKTNAFLQIRKVATNDLRNTASKLIHMLARYEEYYNAHIVPILQSYNADSYKPITNDMIPQKITDNSIARQHFKEIQEVLIRTNRIIDRDSQTNQNAYAGDLVSITSDMKVLLEHLDSLKDVVEIERWHEIFQSILINK